MQDLLKKGLSSVRKEYILQKKLLNSSLENDEKSFNYFSSLYNEFSKSTDEICDQLLIKKNINSLLADFEDVSLRCFGEENGEKYYLFIAGVLLQRVQNMMSDPEFTPPSLIVEEIKNVYHSMLLKNCDISNDSVKDCISANIFSSLSLRKLMCGDVESYNNLCEGKGQLPFEMFDICNDAVFSLSKGVIEAISLLSAGGGIYLKDDYMKLHFFTEKLKLSAMYVVAKKRGFDIRVSPDNLSELTIEAITDAANYGEEYINELHSGKSR